MKHIILTLDYELFGNGKGNVFTHVVEPADKLMRLARKNGARYTIFFEVVEYWRLKEEWERGNTMGYDKNPIAAMEEQIREAVRDGHDVQLHIHPQWVKAHWSDNGWVLNMDDYRLGDYKGEGEDSLVNILRRGKETLENLIAPVKPYYKCVALRCGGYNAQPSESIVKAMREVGLFFDSSIYPGGYENGRLSFYDYRSVPADNGLWPVSDRLDTISETTSDIYELPIVSMKVERWRKYCSMERVSGFFSNVRTSKEMLETKVSGNGARSVSMGDKFKFLLGTECQTWDFCLLPANIHKRFVRLMAQQPDRKYFTLVGHPKSYVGSKNLLFLLKLLNQNNCEFNTIANLYNKYVK